MELDIELELKAMKEELNKVKAENASLKELIVDNGLESELPEVDFVSIEEKICRDGIAHIAVSVEQNDFSRDDVNAFQTLFNVLRAIKGKNPAGNKKVKSAEVKSLLKAIGGGKE